MLRAHLHKDILPYKYSRSFFSFIRNGAAVKRLALPFFPFRIKRPVFLPGRHLSPVLRRVQEDEDKRARYSLTHKMKYNNNGEGPRFVTHNVNDGRVHNGRPTLHFPPHCLVGPVRPTQLLSFRTQCRQRTYYSLVMWKLLLGTKLFLYSWFICEFCVHM